MFMRDITLSRNWKKTSCSAVLILNISKNLLRPMLLSQYPVLETSMLSSMQGTVTFQPCRPYAACVTSMHRYIIFQVTCNLRTELSLHQDTDSVLQIRVFFVIYFYCEFATLKYLTTVCFINAERTYANWYCDTSWTVMQFLNCHFLDHQNLAVYRFFPDRHYLDWHILDRQFLNLLVLAAIYQLQGSRNWRSRKCHVAMQTPSQAKLCRRLT